MAPETTSTSGNQAAPNGDARAAGSATGNNMATPAAGTEPPELDDFGLPIRKYVAPAPVQSTKESSGAITSTPPAEGRPKNKPINEDDSGSEQDFKDAVSAPQSEIASRDEVQQEAEEVKEEEKERGKEPQTPAPITHDTKASGSTNTRANIKGGQAVQEQHSVQEKEEGGNKAPAITDQAILEAKKDRPTVDHSRDTSAASAAAAAAALGAGVGVSEFSHQQLTSKPEAEKKDGAEEDEWQEMPAFAPYDMYDDDNKLIAREHDEAAEDDQTYGYAGLGGAGKGYTRVLLDDDAESATSMDENTNYLFKEAGPNTSAMHDDDMQRDAVSQLQATKDLLTEGQRIAYVGLTRLELSAMLKEAESVPHSKKTRKEVTVAAESMKMWSQKMMIRLYTHMDISPEEQVMIEQLSAHGVVPKDLTPVLMANARVKNPMAETENREADGKEGEGSRRQSTSTSAVPSKPRSPGPPPAYEQEQAAEPPPAYEADDNTELTAPVRTPSQMPTTQKIDIDLRWTVLCDLFLMLIADSIYDARSRVLLERVGKDLEIPWLDICRFEKKVTDALEMQQNAEKENWNEEEHMENRRKLALRRRYVMMGLATVGGGLVIGLSAGLLAPVIGAGLAAGFTTIGVTGTSGFLAGAGGAAIITSGAAASGSIIGGKAANRRTGAVKTFEYRPLHNNKRVNLIVTVSGWMTGKVDDVRLPYSTVDPVMGDIYSVLWEPEMLTSMGDTINILATEALTQGLQQLLGSTILVSLMAALQLPVVLTKLAYLIDNPWAVSLDRATAAGLILADSLIDRNLGTRPVTLVGYSLGSRVIFSCLQELARKGALGLVQNVYLFGSPVVVKQDEYVRARTVVAGRFVNGYNRNDWILGYLFRLTNGGIRRVAGLAPVEGIQDLENMDVTEWVVGHMDYRTAMPRLLRECGWLVESDEFTEIEDADPDNYQERQRELISEIEEARKELEKEEREGGKRESKGFGFFRRKKAPKKEEWEVYEDAHKDKSANGGTGGGGGSGSGRTEDRLGNNHGVLFDVDAIRAELAKERNNDRSPNATSSPTDATANVQDEAFQVKEIKSTLPPMKLELSPNLPAPLAARNSPRDSLRETRSAEMVVPYGGSGSGHRADYQYRSSNEYRISQEHSPSVSPNPYKHDRQVSLQATSKTKTDYGHYRSQSSSPWQTQTTNSYGGGGYGGMNGGFQEEDEIQMTFFDDKDTRPPPPKDTQSSGIQRSTTDQEKGPARPEIRSAQTVPNITLTDPWADYSDDDDEEFGKEEKEISMTFA